MLCPLPLGIGRKTQHSMIVTERWPGAYKTRSYACLVPGLNSFDTT